MPEGRQRVQTPVMNETERHRVYDAVLEETGKGRQVFVVCPVIDESEHPGLLSAKESFQTWKGLFPDLGLGSSMGDCDPRRKSAL